MFQHCDTTQAPWFAVRADVKKCARLNCIAHLLSQIAYTDLTRKPTEQPPRPEPNSYVRPPLDEQNFVPERR